MVPDAVPPHPTRVGQGRHPLSEDTATIAGLRVQLRIVNTRLARIEHETEKWADSTAPTADFIQHLRRHGLIHSGT